MQLSTSSSLSHMFCISLRSGPNVRTFLLSCALCLFTVITRYISPTKLHDLLPPIRSLCAFCHFLRNQCRSVITALSIVHLSVHLHLLLSACLASRAIFLPIFETHFNIEIKLALLLHHQLSACTLTQQVADCNHIVVYNVAPYYNNLSANNNK